MTDLPEALQSIVNPQSYHCLVWYYTAHLHELVLRAYQPPFDDDEVFYLVFQGVSYFEGPMVEWEGADFRLGTKEEIEEVLRRGQISLPQDERIVTAYREQYPLFVIDRLDLKVRILASRHVGKTNNHLDVIRAPLASDLK